MPFAVTGRYYADMAKPRITEPIACRLPLDAAARLKERARLQGVSTSTYLSILLLERIDGGSEPTTTEQARLVVAACRRVSEQARTTSAELLDLAERADSIVKRLAGARED